MLKALLTFVAILGLQSAAFAQDRWVQTYHKADEPGELDVCLAIREYSHGAFVFRIFSNVIDFMFKQNTLALPPSKALGNVRLDLGQASFTLPAYSANATPNTTSVDYFFMKPTTEQLPGLVNALRDAMSVKVVFPNGQFWTIGLEDSNAAVGRAIDCWKQNTTGLFNSNPFEGKGDNPFAREKWRRTWDKSPS